jgi:carboxylesterase
VFVAGFSLGALLALHLAAENELDGLIVLSPALELKDARSRLLPWLRFFVRSIPKQPDPRQGDLTDPDAYRRFWSYDSYPTWGAYQLLLAQRAARADLGRIRCPTLVIYASGDTVIGARSGPTIYEGVAAAEKEMLVLRNSGHGIVADTECETVFEKVYRWVIAP